MTTSNEHNNAPAVPQDMRLVPVWLLERVEQSLGSFTSDEGWAQTDMDTMDSVSAMLATTPAPAPAPAQEFNKSVADAEIKALYVESQGSDKGWLGIEGSYFIGGVVAARKQKAAPAPAQDEPFGYFRAEPFGWADCAKDDEGAIALYERPQEVGLTDDQADAVSMALRRAWQLGQTYWQQADSDYISQHKKSEETQRKFQKLCDDTIAALRAKGGK